MTVYDSSMRPTVELRRRACVVRFPKPQRMLSWAVLQGGMVVSDTVAWLEVRGEELPADVKPEWVAEQRLKEEALVDAVTLMTSRRIDTLQETWSGIDEVHVRCWSTTGLSNAVHIRGALGAQGDHANRAASRFGTINALCQVDVPLSFPASMEALSLVAEARTAAVIEACAALPERPAWTGTGTDCIVVASPIDEQVPHAYAGKHTKLGQAIGQAAFDSFSAGIAAWLEEVRQCTESHAHSRCFGAVGAEED